MGMIHIGYSVLGKRSVKLIISQLNDISVVCVTEQHYYHSHV